MAPVQVRIDTLMPAAAAASNQAELAPIPRPSSAKRKGPEPSTVPHGEAPAPPPSQGSTKKRCKRWPSKQAKVDATAAKKAAIAAEVARGPLPIKRLRGEGPFAPQLMPVGLFDSDEPGERWAAHFDYAPSEVLVSNRGRVHKRGRNAGVGEYEYFTLGSLRKDGYRVVQINGKNRYVHELVCEAFHGPKPSGKNTTVDHYPDRNRSNDRADNLRWATPEEQNGNQGTHRANSTGKPVLARKVGSPDDAEWTPYASATAAGKALGIHVGNISEVCNPEKTDAHTAGGYEFRHAPPPEDQGDLPWEELGPPHARFCVPRERWKLDPESDGHTRVSTRGRVQTKTARGECWSLRHTPRAASGEYYARVKGKGVHLLVWRTFRPDDPPVNGETIDHIDRDEANNANQNLRRATKSEQMRNRDMPSADDIVRPRTPVLAWKDSASREETAERFVGQHAAARALNARFGTTKFTHNGIGQAAHAKKGPGNHKGWRFAFEPETDEEVAAREAQRARVLAAIADLRLSTLDGRLLDSDGEE